MGIDSCGRNVKKGCDTLKKNYISVLISLIMLCLSACSTASKEETLRYAKNEFGKAKYVRTEEIDDKKVRYYFCDEEYDFEYCVTSTVSDILIDGAKFGETESKASDFDKIYYEYVLSRVREDMNALEKKWNVRILDGLNEEAQPGYQYQLAEVYCEASDDTVAQQVAETVNNLFAAYDTRGYWEYMQVPVYDTDGNRLGTYSYKYERWLTPEDERDVLYYEEIQKLNSEAKFVRKEKKVLKETNIPLKDVPDILGEEPITEDSIVTFYYFTVDGREYYLADVLVSVEGRLVWYNNYESFEKN